MAPRSPIPPPQQQQQRRRHHHVYRDSHSSSESSSDELIYSDDEEEVEDESVVNNIQPRRDNDEESGSSSSSEEEQEDDDREVIALFGASSPIGKHFVKLALSAGYHVRALCADNDKENDYYSDYQVIKGSYWTADAHLLREVLHNATYVVCFLTDEVDRKSYQEGLLPQFIKDRLYPLMQRSKTVQLFLYQATATTVDGEGRAPVLSSVLKRGNPSAFQADQDEIVQFIGNVGTNAPFDYIVTRPPSPWLRRQNELSLPLVGGNSSSNNRRCVASKSLPTPMVVTHSALADFCLSSLRKQQLYNSCPYIVASSNKCG